MPVAYDALGGRLLQSLGFDCVYTGGFVTGARAAPRSRS